VICYNISLYSTHAAGLDISYQCLSSGSPGTPTTNLIGNGSISVNIQTTIWANEISWTITNNLGTVVVQGGQGSTYSNNSTYLNVPCLPPGSYTFNWFDSFGDGWHGGSYTISDVNGNTILTSSPSTGSSGTSIFSISDPCSDIYQTTFTGGTPDLYLVTVKFYRDCDGISAPPNLTLNYSSITCGINSNITLNQVGGGTIITPICSTINSTCTGGNVIGIEEYTYQATISISKCPDWVLSVEECCRNNAINTINSPGLQEIKVEATLDNTQFCNNSPTFTQYPVPYICANTPYCYNNGAIDTDGDSLVYSLITPLTNTGTIVYNGIYSLNSPVGGPTSFSSMSGNLCMNPPAPVTSVVAIKVSEYRNGVLIGSIIRDIQVNVLNCTEPPPYLTGIDTLISVELDTTSTINTYNFCSDGTNSLSFNIDALTNSTITNLSMDWNMSIPNATFSVNGNGTSNPTGTFSWTPTLLDVSNSPFFFVVSVTDDACPLMNSFSYSYQINLSNSSASYVASDVSCFGQSDGNIDLTVSGGYSPYSFFWWDSVTGFYSNSEDLSFLSTGNYYCFIVDSIGDTLGCGEEPLNVIINEPEELTVTNTYNNVSCYGLDDGSINLIIYGGIIPYNISWTNSSGTNFYGLNIDSLPPDIYTATITDSNSCGPLFQNILISEPSEINMYANINDITCYGYNDGYINLSTNDSNLIYNWNGPLGFISNNEDIFNLHPGLYNVSISDSNNCIGPDTSYLINEPSDILVNYLISDVSCNGGNDGSIDLTISGGVGNYNTIWTGNNYFNISEDIFTLVAGNYVYNITDSDGCQPSINYSPISINEPAGVTLSATVTHESCYGYADGSIDLIVNGNGTYIYSWVGPNNFVSNNININSLQAGTYNLTVTDQNNCNYYLSENINIGNIIDIDTFVNHITCNGQSNGNITILAPNSVNPTYSWSGPNSFNSDSSQILNLTSGSYSLTINDQTNCPSNFVFSINEPLNLSISSILTDESCEGYSDGNIEVLVSGGTPNYSYIWNNGVTSSLNSNLENGEYILNIIDQNNCILTDTFNINLYLFDTLVDIVYPTCYDGIDGSIDLDISGGNPPFNYVWSNGDTIQDLFNISAGVYNVIITDATNCSINRDVVLSQPQQLSVVSNITNVLCYGDTTGTVSLQINGGVPPYILDWGQTDTNALYAGYHIYNVIDSQLCRFTDSILVYQNDSLEITSNITNVKCVGEHTGSIEIQISQNSGTPPYTYIWSGTNNFYSNNEDIYNLPSGNYNVIISDNNQCLKTLDFTITQPPQLIQNTNITMSNYSGYNVRCKGENSAWIKLDLSGGYPPFEILWNNGNNSDSIYDLYAGNYSVLVTDSLGCSENFSFNLNEPPTSVEGSIQTTSDYNGFHVSCFGYSDGSLSASGNNGVSPYTYMWSNFKTTSNISSLESGYYEVFVYDNNLCFDIDSITIISPSQLTHEIITYPDTCSKSVGSAEINVTGGIVPYVTEWSNGLNGLIVNDFNSGKYDFQIIDDNGCVIFDTILVENLRSPEAEFEIYPYRKRLLDQKNEPFYFVDYSEAFWSTINQWNWSFGDGFFDDDSLVSHIYQDTGEYTVFLEIITKDNCVDTISKKVKIDEYSFYIPNSFMPSSKYSENRVFRGYGIGVEKYKLSIFSRWGSLIFSTEDVNIGWDGTYSQSTTNSFNKNDLCPGGIYTYSVYVKNIYGEEFKYEGQLRLLR
tara:strand:+ start:39777 stop:44912 length:5136 start_codon:yes stop_codon:yes gene_type:complete